MEQSKRKLPKKLTKSKRFWFSVFAFIVNALMFSILVIKDNDPVSVGTGLSMLNTPVYVYVFGESWKPSSKAEKDENV
tara:strand:- start:4338 stop:4571 length:234 start_codon:yes stop_codon:yes gene_type:complete